MAGVAAAGGRRSGLSELNFKSKFSALNTFTYYASLKGYILNTLPRAIRK